MILAPSPLVRWVVALTRRLPRQFRSADKCLSAPAQSRGDAPYGPWLRPPSSFAHLVATLDPVDELRLRIAEQPVDRRHSRQHLEHAEALRANLHRDVRELGDRDHRHERRILE